MGNFKKRLYIVDNIKAIMIFLVVLGHMLELLLGFRYIKVIYIIIYTFHIPIFVYCTGVLARFDAKKILCNLVYPYFVFQFMYILFERKILHVDNVLAFTTPYWILWYLVACIIWKFSIQAIETSSKKKMLLFICFAFILGILAGFDQTVGYYLSISRVIVFYPFFLIGYYQNRIIELVKLHSILYRNSILKYTIVLAALCCAGFVFLKIDIIQPIWLYGTTAYKYTNCPIRYKILFYIIGIVMLLFFITFTPDKKVKLLSVIGERSIYVYIMHGFFIKLFMKYNVFQYFNHKFRYAILFSALIVMLLSTKPICMILKPLVQMCNIKKYVMALTKNRLIIQKKTEMKKLKSNEHIINFTLYFIVLASVILQYMILELSCKNIKSILKLPIKYALIYIIIILFVNLSIQLIVNKWNLTFIITTILFSILSITNYYVIMYHGTPFTFNDFKNINTAINVMSSYEFNINRQILLILINATVIIVLFNIYNKFIKENKRLVNAIALPLLGGFLYFALFSTNSIVPKNAVSWSWEEAQNNYGYLPCLIQITRNQKNIANEPEQYSTDGVAAEMSQYTSSRVTKNATPDIILILNESFYDLKQITEPNTDIEYMSAINELSNKITGYAISPNYGGGTNCSEYELLTSNSLCLMPNITPFNVLDMSNANTIVSYLKSLGYVTLGAHSEPSINYCRGTAYTAIKFDQIYFDDDFKDKEYYYDRYYETDQSLYKNLIKWYEDMDENPRFMYLLTIQNHGAYNLSDDGYDIVHTQNDYGENTSSVNEYLTSIYLSDQYFGELIEYFRQVDRDVIVCMLGDHAPSFAKDIADRDDLTESEKILNLRSVPFVIWANYDLETIDLEQNKISMNYMIPTLLEVAGIKLSPFYDYMLTLRNTIPIMTTYGKYMDSNLVEYNYEEENEYKDIIDQYFRMEYYNVFDNAREQEFFESKE